MKDPVIRLNKSGLTVGTSGIEIEANGNIAGSFTASGTTAAINQWNLTNPLNITGDLTASGNLNIANINATGDISAGNGKNIYASSTLGNTKIIFPYETDNTVYLQTGNGTVGSASNLFIGNWFNASGPSTRKLMYDTSGNLGVGTATPLRKLDIQVMCLSVLIIMYQMDY